jgi:hypothetical protein
MDKSLIINLIYSKHKRIYIDRFYQMLDKKLLVILYYFYILIFMFFFIYCLDGFKVSFY